MEIASPIPIPHGRGGTKRSFACSSFVDEGPSRFASSPHVDAISESIGSCGTTDMSCGNQFKRRRRFSDDDMEDVTSSLSLNSNMSRAPLSTLSSNHTSQHSTNAPPAKRSRSESNGWNQTHAKEQIAIELQRVVDQQAAEIERLKAEKKSVEQSASKLKVEHDKITNENRILKRAITIQQERQNHAQNEIDAATRYRTSAEDRIRRLEQMNLTLRYHLQASQPSIGNDFMGFSPRPPDVY